MKFKIQTAGRSEQIVRHIEQMLAEGELQAGDQLPNERELAEGYGVSRTVIREATKILEEKGLISVQVGRGTFVIDATDEIIQKSINLMLRVKEPKRLLDVLEVRGMLEPEMAALAASRATPETIKALRKAIDKMDRSMDQLEAYIAADQQFHLELAKATQNSFIPVLINSFVDALQEQRKRSGYSEGSLERGQVHHKKILETIIAGDSDAAREAMKAHLHQVLEDIHKMLDVTDQDESTA